MPHSHIPILFFFFNLTLHVCTNFSHGEHWSASRLVGASLLDAQILLPPGLILCTQHKHRWVAMCQWLYQGVSCFLWLWIPWNWSIASSRWCSFTGLCGIEIANNQKLDPIHECGRTTLWVIHLQWHCQHTKLVLCHHLWAGEWGGYRNSIHGHCKRFHLSGTFFWVEYASIYEKLGIRLVIESWAEWT